MHIPVRPLPKSLLPLPAKTERQLLTIFPQYRCNLLALLPANL